MSDEEQYREEYERHRAIISSLRAEIILLDKVLTDARMVLLSSLHDNGQPSQTSLATLNESCRAHFEWKAQQIPTTK